MTVVHEAVPRTLDVLVSVEWRRANEHTETIDWTEAHRH